MIVEPAPGAYLRILRVLKRNLFKVVGARRHLSGIGAVLSVHSDALIGIN